MSYCLFHYSQMLLKHVMRVPELAQWLKKKDPKDEKEEKEIKAAWKIYRRLQALAFYPTEEVSRALYQMMLDPKMR